MHCFRKQLAGLSEKDFECVVCKEIAENAYDCSCCHKLLCKQCLQKLDSSRCPHCNKVRFCNILRITDLSCASPVCANTVC